MNINFMATWGLLITIIGAIGHPSSLDNPPNTATLVFLTGLIIFTISLNNQHHE